MAASRTYSINSITGYNYSWNDATWVVCRTIIMCTTRLFFIFSFYIKVYIGSGKLMDMQHIWLFISIKSIMTSLKEMEAIVLRSRIFSLTLFSKIVDVCLKLVPAAYSRRCFEFYAVRELLDLKHDIFKCCRPRKHVFLVDDDEFSMQRWKLLNITWQSFGMLLVEIKSQFSGDDKIGKRCWWCWCFCPRGRVPKARPQHSIIYFYLKKKGKKGK